MTRLKQAVRALVQRSVFPVKFRSVAHLLANNRFVCRWADRWPCLKDDTNAAGFDAHYLHHTAWAARILAENAPDRHVDIGSCLRFVTMVSAFVPVDFYDWRPAEFRMEHLRCFHGNVTRLPFENNSISSLSCMHVVEHIGLERYGDPFDPKGDMKAAGELARVLSPSGHFLFVVPVGGTARIQYNAHRIYRYADVLALMPTLDLLEFALVTDGGEFIGNAEEIQADRQQYGCGCFHFTKKHEGTSF